MSQRNLDQVRNTLLGDVRDNLDTIIADGTVPVNSQNALINLDNSEGWTFHFSNSVNVEASVGPTAVPLSNTLHVRDLLMWVPPAAESGATIWLGDANVGVGAGIPVNPGNKQTLSSLAAATLYFLSETSETPLHLYANVQSV